MSDLPHNPSAAPSANSLGGAGHFFVLEGIDGSGKSSQSAALCALLAQHGRQVLATREPGGTPLAERLRELVLQEPVDALTELLMMVAARRDHTNQRILPALRQGTDVVCDRYWDSTWAYQGAGRGLPSALLQSLESSFADGAAQPSLTIYFDCPAAVAAARRAGRAPEDRIEQEALDFFERVRQGFLEAAARRSEQGQRTLVIDAQQSPEAIAQAIAQAVCAILKGTALSTPLASR